MLDAIIWLLCTASTAVSSAKVADIVVVLVGVCFEPTPFRLVCKDPVNSANGHDALVDNFDTIKKHDYSHGDDVEQLHLSDVEQRMIAAKLTLEVPTKSIIKSVCDKMALDMKRIDLINKDDIRNIQDFHGIHAKDDCTHQDDSASVHLWAPPNPTAWKVLIKPMSNLQRKMSRGTIVHIPHLLS
ncbi:hypothetical protein HUJ05_002056 [Dendroctonus ponderosae]|nr:hypothetical protein HUJ05_002056 [Dendroctonus ponderosae]